MKRQTSVFTSTTLVTALVASVILTGFGGAALAASADDGNDRARATNVIYLLGDGMGRTHVTAARERYYGAAGKLAMETLPAQGFVSTYAVEKLSGQPGATDFKPNPVTDSASAATAWSSGVKTYNAALGVDAKGTVVPTMMELAKKAGYRTGNVSTAEITDATPAGQMSHALARGCQGPVYSDAACQDLSITGAALPTSDVRVTPIADQIARNGTADVILGGGLSRFDAADETALKGQGYSVLGSITGQSIATKADLAAASGAKVFGLFNKGNLTVEKTKQDNPSSVQAQEPTLSEMTSKAIDLLQKGKNNADKNDRSGKGGQGFYLQIEGALIDKRSHANDAAQTLGEMKAFDDAVAIVKDFAKRDGHTLVIVTADHECAGFNIIEKGTFTNAEAGTPPANVDSGNSANNSTPTRPSNSKDAARSSGIVNGAGAADPKNFGPATFRTPTDAAGVVDGSPDAGLWLTYLSGNHTGADVPVFATGPGSDQLQGTIDNTALFGIVGRALRVV
ncbi:alkaline phosphatase [Cryobacterium sp. MDB1-18-2]|uniref:alkaline phosphatase n=1 Tax=unclassified Cryobacterium TaxID=2649013 RepID=UPI00106C7A6B|nr:MULTISPECIES: alkaline phosphatase [unclassified Cryobacterium]MEB0004379.1 alkaline phosphatase [Cryobacterium sp. RTC2.1]TFC31869.1 alkaline phosphatase [Cryobacterium sp. MDB1-18-2]TFC37697.1 alkaline phosphatase [Cryobacterium sp. MDB1-18-1]